MPGAVHPAKAGIRSCQQARLETQEGRPESAAQMASRALDSLAARGDPSDRAGLLVAVSISTSSAWRAIPNATGDDFAANMNGNAYNGPGRLIRFLS